MNFDVNIYAPKEDPKFNPFVAPLYCKRYLKNFDVVFLPLYLTWLFRIINHRMNFSSLTRLVGTTFLFLHCFI